MGDVSDPTRRTTGHGEGESRFTGRGQVSLFFLLCVHVVHAQSVHATFSEHEHLGMEYMYDMDALQQTIWGLKTGKPGC